LRNNYFLSKIQIVFWESSPLRQEKGASPKKSQRAFHKNLSFPILLV
jgi:hypothetical protein